MPRLKQYTRTHYKEQTNNKPPTIAASPYSFRLTWMAAATEVASLGLGDTFGVVEGLHDKILLPSLWQRQLVEPLDNSFTTTHRARPSHPLICEIHASNC